VGTALIRGKNGLTDTQKDRWKDMRKFTGAVRNYATRRKRTYCKLNFSEEILRKSPSLTATMWSAHIGDRNKIKLQAVRNSVLQFWFPYMWEFNKMKFLIIMNSVIKFKVSERCGFFNQSGHYYLSIRTIGLKLDGRPVRSFDSFTNESYVGVSCLCYQNGICCIQ
jgi:hypothetical protein